MSVDQPSAPLGAGTRLPGTPSPMHHWIGANGNRIAGDAWGDPEGPLVIVQHGGGQTRHAWKRAGRTLGAAGYHAVTLDARGHGDSDWIADGNYSQDAMIADLVAVIGQLGGRRPVLVGASMGGGTSLVAIGEDRVDATALVLVDIAPQIETEGVAKIQAFMSLKPHGFDSLQEVADAIASYQPHREPPKSLAGRLDGQVAFPVLHAGIPQRAHRDERERPTQTPVLFPAAPHAPLRVGVPAPARSIAGLSAGNVLRCTVS